MYSKKERFLDYLFVILYILLTFLLVSVVYYNVNIEQRYDNGVIVDKFRGRYNSSMITVEKDNNISTFEIPINEYLSYEIGDTFYAQE